MAFFIEVPHFNKAMYDINLGRDVDTTIIGFELIHYETGKPGKFFESDEALQNSSVDMKIKLCDGHWLIAQPKLEQDKRTGG